LLLWLAVFEALRRVGRLSNYDKGPLDRIAAKVRLPLDRLYNERIIPDVRKLSASVRHSGGQPEGPHVMIVSLRVWPNCALTEVLIGKALEQRGARVSLLTCGGGLPICEVGWARRAWPRPCDRCAHFTDRVAVASGFPHYRFADYLPWGTDGSHAPQTYREIAARPSMDYEKAGAQTAAWVLKTTSPHAVPEGPDVLRDSAVTAAAVELAANRIIDVAEPDVMFMVNGILVEEHVLAKVAKARGIRAVTYGYGIHENTIVMSSDDLPALDFKNEPLWQEARGEPLTESEGERLDRYLAERERGAGTADFFARVSHEPEELKRELGIQSGRRLISMFTNITWDSACLNKDVAFSNADEWIRHAVRTVAARDDCQLVIRVHPAEASLGTLEPAEQAVGHEFPALPPNVRFIASDEQVNSYALVDASDTVLVYSSTTGLEAVVRGKPVVVAGDVHYRGRGFTIDLERPEDLTEAIARGTPPPDDEQRELARRYAYAYFFRLMTPVPEFLRQTSYTFAEVRGDDVSLEPGADRYLDLICDRILDGHPLSTPRELVQYPTPFPTL
jgi:Capsule polysaccharide biosynthesis protein